MGCLAVVIGYSGLFIECYYRFHLKFSECMNSMAKSALSEYA